MEADKRQYATKMSASRPLPFNNRNIGTWQNQAISCQDLSWCPGDTPTDETAFLVIFCQAKSEHPGEALTCEATSAVICCSSTDCKHLAGSRWPGCWLGECSQWLPTGVSKCGICETCLGEQRGINSHRNPANDCKNKRD